MKNRIKDRSKKSDQKNHLQNMSRLFEENQEIARLFEENQELEKKYNLASSKLDHLENRMQNLKHDLRGPLSGITGMLDLLIIEDKDQVKIQTSHLIMIKKSAQSILDLVNGTLVVEGTENSLKKNLNIDRILSSVMVEINRLYLPMAQNKGITLSMSTQIDTEIQLLPNFFTDLIQITGNLVANAIKFTPANGSVDVLFTLDAEDNHSILNMTVSDTGKGMSPDQVSAFNQGKPVARSMGTNGEQGFGIGLQHVIEMVFEENGRIVVESEKGLGTLFSLSFPLPGKNLTRKSMSHFIVKNGTVAYNGQQS
jgi:signal transduction histidine kinase